MAEREVVFRRPGADWSFHLPEQHRFDFVDEERRCAYVVLSTPGESTRFVVEEIDESDADERVVALGRALDSTGPGGGSLPESDECGYPLPEIQDEFERLQTRWRTAGLDEQEFVAWPQGANAAEQLRRIRRRLRDAGR